MEALSKLLQVVILALLCGLLTQETYAVRRNEDTLEMDCVPSIQHKFDACPAGYCCVRDEFLATYVYCKKIGALDDNCTTRESESACPCGPGLYCKANIMGTFPSLYGKCVAGPNSTMTTFTAMG